MCFVCENRYVTQYKELYHAIYSHVMSRYTGMCGVIFAAISGHLYKVTNRFSQLEIFTTVDTNGKTQKQINLKISKYIKYQNRRGKYTNLCISI